MTNAIIRRIIILGAIAIASLLTVQTYWILRTYDLQEHNLIGGCIRLYSTRPINLAS